MKLIRLLYISTAKANISSNDIKNIVDVANVRNGELHITGALAYNGLHFAQVLEGEESKINALMDSIRKDSRHFNVIEIMRKPVSERHFEDWNMKILEGIVFDDLIKSMNR